MIWVGITYIPTILRLIFVFFGQLLRITRLFEFFVCIRQLIWNLGTLNFFLKNLYGHLRNELGKHNIQSHHFTALFLHYQSTFWNYAIILIFFVSFSLWIWLLGAPINYFNEKTLWVPPQWVSKYYV